MSETLAMAMSMSIEAMNISVASDSDATNGSDRVTHDDNSPFCTSGMMGDGLSSHGGGGMIMYMDGFRFSLKGGQPCLNLYFPSWTLDTRTKFVWAMIGIVLMAVATEGISKLRFFLTTQKTRLKCKRLAIASLHALQALAGYVLMLAAMTFSAELLACVIFGLAMGYSLFFDDDDMHVTTNPCCNFMQTEADERAVVDGSIILLNKGNAATAGVDNAISRADCGCAQEEA